MTVAVSVAWVATNFLQAWSGVDFLGATWASPVYALYAQVWFLQPQSIFGFLGFDLLLLTINFALARMVIVLIDMRFIERDVYGQAHSNMGQIWGLDGLCGNTK